MATTDRLLRCVESIYAAGLSGDGWTGALAALADFTGSLGATFEVFEKAPPRLIEFAVAGLPVGAETAYLDHYAQHNPRAAYAFAHLSQVFLADYQFFDEHAMDRDAYYAKYLTSIDLRYFLSAQVFNGERAQAVITIQRSRRQGHVGPIEIDRVRRLLPHFRRAHDMASRLRGANAAVGELQQMLEWLSDGVALVRSDGTVVYANGALRAFAAAGDGLALARGAIEFDAPRARARLAAAIGTARRLGNAADAPPIVDFAVARPSGAPPYLVSVRPVMGGAEGPWSDTRAIAAVFVRDLLQRHRTETRVLREAFGLTEAEADVARGLQTGLSPSAHARARSLSRNTVYTHLRRIKEKTGCTRTSELVAKLNGASLPVRPH
jgi:DNA-binding CsgD family transcriptional regulator